MIDRIKNTTRFLISNFGPLIGFYFVNHFWGFQMGVVVSIALVIIEFIWLKLKKLEIGRFFYFSSAMILCFGIADLVIQAPFFIKYEASITNLIFAVFFGSSLFKEKSIIQEIAESQGRTSTESSVDKIFFFKLFTLFWCLYFVGKAAFYLWLNSVSTLEEGMIIRLIVGKLSFWMMMFISIGLPRKIWKLFERLKIFPSQRAVHLSKAE